MKKIFTTLFVAGIAIAVMAVPARRGGVVRTAADGTEKTVFLQGDECYHYITDEEGNWLDEETLLPISVEKKALRMSAKTEGNRAKVRRAKAETGTGRLLAPRGAVILVSFSDLDFEATNAEMTEWAMGENYTYNGATGSIHKYFMDQSWGQYDLQIDVVGPVKVSKQMSYYGQNDYNGDDKHADELVVEACKLAHDQGIDFSKYDFNNDGYVDWVVILYAGYGEASNAPANTIWPHQYELSYTGKSFKLDGKTIDHYCCLNEKEYQTKKRDGIGTFCHEFSHVMGLPDFYATTQDASHRTLGSWDIMDYGSYNNNGNTPPNYSAYERWFMGWFQPRLVNQDASVILPPMVETAGAVYMTENGDAISDILTPSPNTFYMFENRKRTGWDKYLKGSGLMITKIKWSKSKWENNTVNNSSSNMGVDLIEAKTNTSSSSDKSTDLYPVGATEFTMNTNYQVTNIALTTEGVITFDVNGGGATINLDVENVEAAAAAVKQIENGRVVIFRDGKKYDILGNRL